MSRNFNSIQLKYTHQLIGKNPNRVCARKWFEKFFSKKPSYFKYLVGTTYIKLESLGCVSLTGDNFVQALKVMPDEITALTVYPGFIAEEDHIVSKTYMTRVEGETPA